MTIVLLYSPNVSGLSGGRDAISQHHRTLWHQYKRVFLVEIWFIAIQLVSRSFPCRDNAGGHGWFSCTKILSSLVLTNLCTNKQLADDIAVSLHLLKLLLCLRVCRSEVTTLGKWQLFFLDGLVDRDLPFHKHNVDVF